MQRQVIRGALRHGPRDLASTTPTVAATINLSTRHEIRPLSTTSSLYSPLNDDANDNSGGSSGSRGNVAHPRSSEAAASLGRLVSRSPGGAPRQPSPIKAVGTPGNVINVRSLPRRRDGGNNIISSSNGNFSNNNIISNGNSNSNSNFSNNNFRNNNFNNNNMGNGGRGPPRAPPEGARLVSAPRSLLTRQQGLSRGRGGGPDSGAGMRFAGARGGRVDGDGGSGWGSGSNRLSPARAGGGGGGRGRGRDRRGGGRGAREGGRGGRRSKEEAADGKGKPDPAEQLELKAWEDFMRAEERGIELPYTPTFTPSSLTGFGPAVPASASGTAGAVESAMRAMRVLGGGQPFLPSSANEPSGTAARYESGEPVFLAAPGEKEWLVENSDLEEVKGPMEETKQAIVRAAVRGEHEPPRFAELGDTMGVLSMYHAREATYKAGAADPFNAKVASLLARARGAGRAPAKGAGT